ncbi:MAG: hypothetical protein IJO63_01365 [Bacilli bacterium]|nr:hypothetical protein [Bacilli bacterium]
MVIVKIDSGSRSLIQIPIIIAKEKDKEKVKNLLMLSLLMGKKINKAPISVDIPAKKEIRRA